MSIIHMAAGVTGLICLSLSCAYAFLAIVALICRSAERPHQPQPAGPPVTVLKPLCGAEPDLYANLRTLDKAGCARILVQEVPGDERWDAIRDRLARASVGAGSDSGSYGALGTGVLP